MITPERNYFTMFIVNVCDRSIWLDGQKKNCAARTRLGVVDNYMPHPSTR
jgi:hypothetical protein